MTVDPTPSSGSRWRPGTLTGLGGFAIGLAVGDDAVSDGETSEVRQESGRAADDGRGRGGGRVTPPDGQGEPPARNDGSTGQGT
jgi:hypothetical protein